MSAGPYTAIGLALLSFKRIMLRQIPTAARTCRAVYQVVEHASVVAITIVVGQVRPDWNNCFTHERILVLGVAAAQFVDVSSVVNVNATVHIGTVHSAVARHLCA